MARMTFNRWLRTYQPKPHGLTSQSFDGCLCDSLDEDEKQWAHRAYRADPRTVWTFMEMDGRLFIVAGWGLVNRLGYFVCAHPFVNEWDAPEVPLGRF